MMVGTVLDVRGVVKVLMPTSLLVPFLFGARELLISYPEIPNDRRGH